MAKLDWTKAKRRQTTTDRTTPDRADRWLERHQPKPEPRSRVEFSGARQPHRQRKHKPEDPNGIWIVVGADAPSNKTGSRIVHHFRTRAAAHAAGFGWAT